MTKTSTAQQLSVGQFASLACLLEVTAPKPGNVHRGADFEDVSFSDFAVSAVAIAPAMDAAADVPLGETILQAIQTTRHVVCTNTNLGMVLLFAPIAAVLPGEPLAPGIARVLSQLSPDDARNVYDAIRLATPGGLGKVDNDDIAAAPPEDLIRAMRSAAHRDMVARQYDNGFADVLNCAMPWLCDGVSEGWTLVDSIVHAHMRLMSQLPDSLIRRKCGYSVAQEAADRAAHVLDAGQPGEASYLRALADLDFWLRSDGHRRNPGTTADLIAAGLFAAFRDGRIQPPFSSLYGGLAYRRGVDDDCL